MIAVLTSFPGGRIDSLSTKKILTRLAEVSDAERRFRYDPAEREAPRFQALPRRRQLIIPNPSNAGTARVLEALGFQALATTSSGFAFTLGAQRRCELDEVAEHVARLMRRPRCRLGRPENG